jgi:hypothetical protein
MNDRTQPFKWSSEIEGEKVGIGESIDTKTQIARVGRARIPAMP